MRLVDWIVGYKDSVEYAQRIAELTARKPMSPPAEIAMMAGIIEHLKPDRVLEIGTFTARTAQPLAEAIERAGKGMLTTIDPFGAERIPPIIATWPASTQAVTEFLPDFSMAYFSRLEEMAVRSKPTPLGLVFVDGNHSFHYALYDILSAAANLVPGGAICVDNCEQDGPKFAVLEFLRMNPAWSAYFRGNVYDANRLTSEIMMPVGLRTLWVVLLAPDHVQVVKTGYKARGKFRSNTRCSGIRLNVSGSSGAVRLSGNFLYICRPTDYHITGVGVMAERRDFSAMVRPGIFGSRDIVFDTPISVAVPDHPMNFTYQLEIAAATDGHDYVLLDADAPFELVSPSPDQ